MGVGRIDTPQARQIVQTVAAQLIIGYAPPHMVATGEERRSSGGSSETTPTLSRASSSVRVMTGG